MDDAQNALQLARRILTQRLESLERSGVKQLRKAPPTGSMAVGASPPSAEPLAAPRSEIPNPQSQIPNSPAPPVPLSPASTLAPRSAASMRSLLSQPYPPDLPTAANACQSLLAAAATELRTCTLCRELASTRKQTVYGVGHPRPRVVFFGEAPGADEDRQGEPFVGRAGQLLTKIIEACGWQRSDVYIMNVLKCRPPENRNPSPIETDNCRPFFERQFEILRPEYIVCVGTVPAQALLETADSIGKLRGRFFRYRDSKVLCTYHPSYLLRNPAAKKYVWEDMQLLLKEMGLPVPKRSQEPGTRNQ